MVDVLCRLVRPPLRRSVAGYLANRARRPGGTHTHGVSRAAARRRPPSDGAVLCRNALSYRRQRDPHAGLWQLDCARHSRRRAAAAPRIRAARNGGKYRDWLAETGRFLTFSAGGATIGYRFRADPNERASLRLIKETDAGIVVRGKVGMHTSVPFAEEVYIGAGGAVTCGSQRATFVVPVAAPGVTVVCRQIAARHQNPFLAPLSSRFDELDAQMWLDDVFIPWERVFLTEPPPTRAARLLSTATGGRGLPPGYTGISCTGWLAKAEFTLGLALACTDAMGLREDQQTLEYLVDLIVDVQTVRSCITAAELDPEVTQAGYVFPGLLHIAAGSIAMLKARQAHHRDFAYPAWLVAGDGSG